MKNGLMLLVPLVLLAACRGSGGGSGPDGGGAEDSGVADAPVDAVPVPGVLLLNEVVVAGGEDWLELVVLGDEPVVLSAYTLVDDNPDHEPAPLPAVSLSPGEFLVIRAVSVDEIVEGPSVPFRLGGGDALTLRRLGEVVDVLEWEDGDAPEGTSWGRLPDGQGAAQTLLPTPGAANEALDGPPVVCTDPFVTDRVVSVSLELDLADWQDILANPKAEEFHPGAFVWDGLRVEEVGIRTKGNSSLSSATRLDTIRLPFKVDFNLYVDGQEFCGYGKLVFNNGFKDPTLLRESLAYRAARAFGMPAPRTAFVDLTVAGEHLGLYTMVEPVDEDRFLQDHFEDADGDLYKPEQPDGVLAWKGDAFTDYPGIQVEQNADTTDHAALLRLIDVLEHGPAEDLEEVLDVDATLRFLAFDAFFVNLDSYPGSGHNYYLYEQDGRFLPVLWDVNEAFGNFTCTCDRDSIIGFLVGEPTCGPPAQKPLVRALLGVPAYLDRFHELLDELGDGPGSVAGMGPWIQEAADLVRPYVQADPTKFYSTEDFETGLTDDVSSGNVPMGGTAIGLATFLEERGASVASQLAGTLPSTAGGLGNCTGSGPRPPPGKCPDGVCDAAEQANPMLCPEDCA
ncbi:MAG: CotH kinase family protein [Deltaproteobacteria bacterium]|nr:CotH kinase family protein [Deltaproteobacteria bacterium]